jgi:hypothetical protein
MTRCPSSTPLIEAVAARNRVKDRSGDEQKIVKTTSAPDAGSHSVWVGVDAVDHDFPREIHFSQYCRKHINLR